MTVTRRGRRLELVLDGELDIASAPECPAPGTLFVEGVDHVLVDMRDLTFLDLEGLRYVLELRAVAREHGCEFRVLPGPRHVRRVFELTGQDVPFSHAA